MLLVSKKKEPRYACLSEVKASHLQRIWAEVSSIIPHLLHNGLSSNHLLDQVLDIPAVRNIFLYRRNENLKFENVISCHLLVVVELSGMFS
jgi:hypothetical protein